MGEEIVCPADDGTHIDQIVGKDKHDYLVYCDTELITEDRVRGQAECDSPEECTTRCTTANSEGGKNVCSASSFTP